MLPRFRPVWLVVLGVLAGISRDVRAQMTPIWAGGASGNWGSAGNWVGGVPGAGSVVTINHGGANVSLSSAGNASSLTIGPGDTVTIANGQSLRIKKTTAVDGVITNAATLALNNTSALNNTDLVIEGGDVTLTGGGQVTLSNSGNNRIYGTAATDRLINENNTISGAGQIGRDLMGLINRGLIAATQTNDLTIDPSAAAAINSGTLRANGGTLNLVNGTFTNFEGAANGMIEALGTSTVDLNGATIIGGNLRTDAGASIRNVGSATLNGITLQAVSRFSGQNNTVTTLVGTLTNLGQLTLNNTSPFNNTDFLVDAGDVTISGGEIVFSNHANNRIRGTDPTYRLILDNATLSGGGQVGTNSVGVVNRGTIVANQTSELTLDPSAAGFVNRGTLRADGGTLNLNSGTFTNSESGTPGLIEARAGSAVDFNASTVVGGNLATSGTGLLRNVDSVRFEDVTFNAGAAFSGLNNTTTTLAGSIQNHGTLSLNNTSVFNNTDLMVSGTVTVAGNGAIALSDHGNNRIRAQNAGDRLINVAHTINGAGQLGANGLALTNRGSIHGTFTTPLVIDTAGVDNFNRGTLASLPGGVLQIHDTTLTNREDGVAGQINANGGQVRITGGSVISFGNVNVIGAGELQLNGSTLSETTLQGSSTGTIRTTGGTSVLDRGSLFNPGGGRIVVSNNSSLQFNAGGSYTNAGTLHIENTSAFNNTDVLISGGDVTIGGSGEITTSNHGNNRVRGLAPTDRLVLDGGTFAGSGHLGLNSMGVVNRGTVVANQSIALTIDPSDVSGVVNTGVLRANGGTLNLRGGTFTNFAGPLQGTLDAAAGSFVDLDGVTIAGGFLQTAAGGHIRASGTATLDGVSVTPGSSYFGANNSATTLRGSIQNAGVISLNNTSAFNNTDLILGGDVTLSGGGTVTLSNHTNNRVRSGDSTLVLTNVDNTIEGSGHLGLDSMGLINRHLVVANQSTPLTIDPGGTVGVTNRGTLRADGGTLSLANGTFTNSEAGIAGTIEARNGSSVDLNGATVVGGQFLTTATGQIRNVGSATLQDVMLNAATFSGANNSSTKLVGTLHNSGTLSLNNTSAFNNTDLRISGTVTLAGNGTVSLGDHGNNRVFGDVGGEHLINAGNLIQGGGQLGLDRTTITNRGSIVANLTTPLTVDPGAGGVVNESVLRADGGTLRLIGGTFTSTGATFHGRIEAINAGAVELNGTTLVGGTIATAAGSQMRNTGAATLDGVSFDPGATFSANNNSVTTLAGTIQNLGTLSLNNSSAFNNTDLSIPGSVTLAGVGSLTLSNHGNNRILGTGTLTNAPGHAIRGSGQLGVNQLALVNQGVIEANQSTPLTVNLGAGAPFTNQGTLRATHGGNLIFTDALTNAGFLAIESGSTFTAQAAFTQSGGATLLKGGTFNAASAAFQNGAVLQGGGTVIGPVSNSGVISPGASANALGTGVLTFNHTLTLQPLSLLNMEIGGGSDYDRINAPSIALNGHLAVSFTNGFQFAVQPGESFTLLATTNAAGLSGVFAGLPNGGRLFTADGAGSFQVNYLGNALTLSNFQAIPEPSTYALLALGGGVIFILHRRRRK